MRSIIASTAAALAFAATPATAGIITVGSTPEIRADIQLAQQFWTIERPGWHISCIEHATLTTLPADIWAETNLYSCNIQVSQPMWETSTATDSQDRYNVCIAIAHEYGHTLGYWDNDGPPIMDTAWAPRFDPLCTRAVGIPLTQRAVRWLTRRATPSS